MPSVCRNWSSLGNCAYGERCKFLHPPSAAPSGFSSTNRFAALDPQSQAYNRRDNSNQGGGHRRSSPAPQPDTLPYQLDKAAIITDLTSERPQWLLSAYGPGRHAPEQMFGGPAREKSFEEMRLRHYAGIASGNPQQAVAEAANLVQQSEQQIRHAINDIDGAINFIIQAANTHPNRLDALGSQEGAGSQSTPFGNSAPRFGAASQPAAPSAFGAASGGLNGFGQASTLGQKPSAFGAPSGGGGGFGQASALGQTPRAFGAPSERVGGFGQTPNSFGAATGSGGFGQPSTLGQTSNAFRAPSQPVIGGGFGQPSTLGQNLNTFGAPSKPATGVFGQPSTMSPSTAPASVMPLMGQQVNPFGALSQSAPINPYGTQTKQPNPFGQSMQNGFAATNTSQPFGAPSPAKNPFAAQSTPNPLSTQTQQLNGFGLNPINTTGPTTHPPISSYSSSGPNGRLTMFKGKPVVYHEEDPGVQNQDGSWAKIWFPNGAPPYYKDTELEDADYDDSTKAAYQAMMQNNGMFAHGTMPMLPPKRDWCSWDF